MTDENIIERVIEDVENEFSVRFKFRELVNAAYLAKRKCVINKKDANYFPYMLQEELRNIAMGNIIKRQVG